MGNYIIEMLNITKRFPGIIANDSINLQLKKGEIHALLGENGAGKSTLMSVLFGLYQPEEGEIRKNGQKVQINNPNDANNLGIGMVHQHFKLVEVFSVLENIILGVEPSKRGFVDYKEARVKVNEIIKKYNFGLDADELIANISVGKQQKVEILKMLYRDNEILIFDEPTAVLTPQEIDELMEIMKSFAKDGKSILFITHKLNEIKEVADRCTVLQKGKYKGTVDVKTTSVEELTKMMVGRDINLVINKEEFKGNKSKLLEVNDLVVHSATKGKDAVDNVSFFVNKGEIVCIAGIEGNGQSELIQAITGLSKASSGSILLNGIDITKFNVRNKTVTGLSHIPEDRHKYGLVLEYTLANNIVLQRYWQPRFQNKGFLKKDEINSYAEELVEKYDVRSGKGINTITRSMSGGNQQKAIIAREIEKDFSILIAAQPTRGLDVGAIEFIHKQIVEVRDEGKGVLLMSLELDEVMNLSDRILVMYEGKIVGDLDPKKVTIEELGLYMSGAKNDFKGASSDGV
ncbi:MAG: ABC transporter ATP-binding protein [Acholeplasma sp.]|nr:ABC transporter ATP-binding protein [Acholeplasma sp.]